MKNGFYLIILFLINIQIQAKMYDESQIYDCKDEITDEVQEKINYQKLKLFPIDCWIFLLLSPVTFCISIRIIYEFLQDFRLFGGPGDIIFVITATNGVQSIIQFSTALYVQINDSAPVNIFCDITGIATSIVFVISNLNIFIFAAYPLALVYNSLESTVKCIRIFNYSFTAIIIIIVFLGFILNNDIISITLNGMCAISATKKKIWDFIIALVYLFVFLLFATMSLIYVFAFKKLVPKMSSIRQLRGQYLRYYQKFITFSLIMKFFLGIFSAVNLLNCYYFYKAYLLLTETFQNVTQSLCILGQVIIITRDPLLIPKFKHTQTSNSQQDFDTSNDKKPVEISMQYFRIQYFRIIVKRNEKNISNFNVGWQKQEQIIFYKDLAINDEQEDGEESSQGDLSELFEVTLQPFVSEEVEECLVVNLNNDLAKSQLYDNQNIQVFQMRCILYAPKIFNYFVTLDNVDIEDSFDVSKNLSKVEQFTGPDGGKSGEFFFFTHNNQFILKTMRQSEVNTYKKRLLNFATYQANNPSSLLNKIYGMYTFERSENAEAKVHFLIMKNLSLGIPRNQILRTYDLKGSEYDREVLAKKPESDLSKLTLKDLDFFKIEQQIWVEKTMIEKLNQNLIKDSNFLENQNLIDYSLLVMKIDWKSQQQLLMQQLSDQQINIIPSIKEQGIYYHIGIIDYLQQWNVNKSLERKTKKIIRMNLQLDTSAQEPNRYGKRFKEKLINRILPL
ncbi:unnamed protein product (macronuclear) [Paramecium tetraurelia]|uniref:PIPK domain-containing protein n=1 Tax=Paramecium tetraurelia TaxID=5888 RepID=A0CVD9_PARTE|nr:uncharacterized protein GSPATT00010924001 [Paramecium tetraurelia]CAK74756.1 unnamed protein product [Paramecium tetraurelia]|eukprot:XP_001442153.1 hypothetical protein (macronuclear) [Paramecium tetraurelia strain d4-2]